MQLSACVLSNKMILGRSSFWHFWKICNVLVSELVLESNLQIGHVQSVIINRWSRIQDLAFETERERVVWIRDSGSGASRSWTGLLILQPTLPPHLHDIFCNFAHFVLRPADNGESDWQLAATIWHSLHLRFDHTNFYVVWYCIALFAILHLKDDTDDSTELLRALLSAICSLNVVLPNVVLVAALEEVHSH